MSSHCNADLYDEVEMAHAFANAFVVSERGQRHAKGLDAIDFAAFHLYTQESQAYRCVNGALGGWGDGGTAPLSNYMPYIRLLTIAMDKSPKVELTTYRGARNVPLTTLLKGCGVGDVVTWNAFTSSAASPDVLQDELFLGFDPKLRYAGPRTVFVIKLTSGVRIEHFSDHGSASEYYMTPVGVQEDVNEQEVLSAPGTQFHIDAIVKRDNNITEVQMHEVPPGSDKGGVGNDGSSSSSVGISAYSAGFASKSKSNLPTATGSSAYSQGFVSAAAPAVLEEANFAGTITLPVPGASSTDVEQGGAGVAVPLPTAPLPTIAANKAAKVKTKAKKKFKQSSKAFERKGSVVGLLASADDGESQGIVDANGMMSI
jgi:hypothetical protein